MNPFLSESDDRFELRPSTIANAGLGVFARIDLEAGAMLEVIGVVVEGESISDRCTHFADHHKFRIGGKLLIPVGFGGLVKHSSNPNLEKVIGGECVWLRAPRPIAAGEEVFFRYPDAALERFGIPQSE
ncbi:MAG TPA: SET domain-containing protein-lysine N-methyltransferase [Urbifossiella sp.]